MRVLHIGKFFPPFAGGIENFIGDLMPALLEQGVDVKALVHSSPAVRGHHTRRLDESRVLRVPCYGSILYAPVSPGFPFVLNRMVKEFQPHIIHLHVPNTSAFWVMLSRKAARIPWVVHWHSDVVPSLIDRRLAAAYSLYRPFEQRLLAHSTKVIATSARYLESSIPLTPWKKKCTVIPLGINPERLPEAEKFALRNAEQIWRNPKSLRILSIGRLTYYKGHEVLIRAVAEMKDLQLVIVGVGDKKAELEQLIQDLQIQDKIQLMGLLPETELQALLASSDCFCLPSVERTEAFGLVLLEAMRYGKAVIASDVPGSGVGWVVQEGKTGRLFPTGDVLELGKLLRRCSARPEERKNMGMEGQKRFASEFNINQVAGQTIDLYNDILASKMTTSHGK